MILIFYSCHSVKRLHILTAVPQFFALMPKKHKGAASLSSLTLDTTPTSCLGPSLFEGGGSHCYTCLCCSKLSLLEGVVSLSPPVSAFCFTGSLDLPMLLIWLLT